MLKLQRAGRVRPFPFHFLDNNKSMNVQPANYGWAEFYDRVIDVSEHAFSWPSIGRRLAAQGANLPGAVNLIRGISSEGFGRVKYHREIRAMLETDEHMRRFFEGETDALPEFYRAAVERKLGPLWQHLPEGALAYDPVAYLVVPRVLAGAIMFPMVITLANAMGVLSGWGTSLVLLDMSSPEFLRGLRLFFVPWDVHPPSGSEPTT